MIGPPLLEQRPVTELCLCPGCYWVPAPDSEMCDSCALHGCTNEDNNHG